MHSLLEHLDIVAGKMKRQRIKRKELTRYGIRVCVDIQRAEQERYQEMIAQKLESIWSEEEND